MNEIIKVGNSKVPIIEWDGQRVITTAQLAEIYETDTNNIQNNINRNQDRFSKEIHYYLLKSEELREFKRKVTNSDLAKPNVNQLYLWTKRGASRHCKILDTEKAWEQFDYLEEQYFNPKISLPTNYIEALQCLIDKEKEKKLLEVTIQGKNQLIGELKPKADYVDHILQNKGLVTITQISKDYGMSGETMNKLLHKLGVQYFQSKQWLLYSKHHGMGYTHSETYDFRHKDGTPDVRMNTKWTQKGRLFLYELLKGNGWLPVIEHQRTA